MTAPQRILLQTTIQYAQDDWNAGRFSLLAGHLRSKGHSVTARDRGTPAGQDDPFLVGLSGNNFDEIWVLAVDTGDGLTPAECDAISAFRQDGGGVLAARDHMDLGSSLCGLAGIGAAQFFHNKQQPAPADCAIDDNVTTAISWPNFHSGDNGDVQRIAPAKPVHPVFLRPDGSIIETLPSHPHEGGVGAPAGDASARNVASGTSAATGRHFTLAVAFETEHPEGRAWAESSFHHFVDLNWDTRKGCPTFVTEMASDVLERNPSLLDDTKLYVANLATWLARR
jgi:hypothetical protein